VGGESAAFAVAGAASDSGRSPLSVQGTVSFCEITNTNRTSATALVIMGTVGQVPFRLPRPVVCLVPRDAAGGRSSRPFLFLILPTGSIHHLPNHRLVCGFLTQCLLLDRRPRRRWGCSRGPM
jgi:hypothetical protein